MSYRRNKMNSDVVTGIGCIFPFVILGIALVSAFFTHIFWTFGTLMNENGVTVGQMVLAIIGVLIPPAGILHGFYLWFI